MFRALITLLVTGVLVILMGVPLLIAGMFRASPRLVNWVSWQWSRAVLGTAGVRVLMEGAEEVCDGQPRFFVGNHQSAFDIPILIVALRGRVRFLAKDSLFRIPVFGWVLSRYGYIPIRRADVRGTAHILEAMLAGLRKRPISVAVFPEGTRSTDGRLLPFHRGTMKICQRAEIPVVPFSIDGSLARLRRGRLHVSPGPVHLRFAPAIPASEVAAMESAELLQRLRSDIARGLPEAPNELNPGVQPALVNKAPT